MQQIDTGLHGLAFGAPAKQGLAEMRAILLRHIAADAASAAGSDDQDMQVLRHRRALSAP